MAFDWNLDAAIPSDATANDASTAVTPAALAPVSPPTMEPLPTRRSLRMAAQAKPERAAKAERAAKQERAAKAVPASRPVPVEPAANETTAPVSSVPLSSVPVSTAPISTVNDLFGALITEATPTASVPTVAVPTVAAPTVSTPTVWAPAASAAPADQSQSRREARLAALSAPARPAAARPASDRPASARTAARAASASTAKSRPPRAAGSQAPRSARPSFRRIVPRVVSVSAALGALALLVSTSLPANAFMPSAADAEPVSVSAPTGVQKMAPVDAKVVAEQAPVRDSYTVQTSADRFRTSNSTDWSYTNDPNGTIQWPFPVQVPISTGFGPRHVPGCGFCSTFHLGVDFDPGRGAPIGAIADGVVTAVDLDPSSPLGNHVTIEHMINGQRIDSVYGHMLTGSVRVVVGESVKVTQLVGQVGSTGNSTGAHLHLEVHVNGVPVDPFAWLKANAN